MLLKCVIAQLIRKVAADDGYFCNNHCTFIKMRLYRLTKTRKIKMSSINQPSLEYAKE